MKRILYPGTVMVVGIAVIWVGNQGLYCTTFASSTNHCTRGRALFLETGLTGCRLPRKGAKRLFVYLTNSSPLISFTTFSILTANPSNTFWA